MECTRWHKNQQAYLEVIKKENKTDDVICLHFGVYGNICGHMIPSSDESKGQKLLRHTWAALLCIFVIISIVRYFAHFIYASSCMFSYMHVSKGMNMGLLCSLCIMYFCYYLYR